MSGEKMSRKKHERPSAALVEPLEARRLMSITVTTTADTIANDGVTSLREAVALAAKRGGDTVAVPVGTYLLQQGELKVPARSGHVVIQGPGATIGAGGV